MRALIPAIDLPLHDDFSLDVPAGEVIGTRTTTGHLRHGVDAEGVMSIDHQAARISPLVQTDWGRSGIAYGPFAPSDGLIASVVLLNGRNGSENTDPWPSLTDWFRQWVRGTQSDGPAARMLRFHRLPQRDRLTRRLRAVRAEARRPDEQRSDLNLAVSWTPTLDISQPERGPSAIVRANGPDNAELCLAEGGSLWPVAALLELPMCLVFVFAGAEVSLLAAIADTRGGWTTPTLLGTLAASTGRSGWLSIQQRTLGQVGWGMDTRVREVHVDHLADEITAEDVAAGRVVPAPLVRRPHGRAVGNVEVFVDPFDQTGPDLAGTAGGGRPWRHVVGTRRIGITGDGATVGAPIPGPTGRLARLVRASGQRTAYVVDWDGSPGSISTEITPPGNRRGDGHAGRGGLILFQDDDNFLIVNDWLDDAFGGASVSAFRRVNGHEEVYDAVWANVGERITWGRRHELTLAFDRSGFTAFVDGEAVLDREFSDVYPAAEPVEVRAVGICANWEFGDDTGSRFRSFTARSAG